MNFTCQQTFLYDQEESLRANGLLFLRRKAGIGRLTSVDNDVDVLERVMNLIYNQDIRLFQR